VFIVQSFVAQLVGRGEPEAAPRFAWYGLAIAGVAGVLGLLAIPFLEPALSLTDYSPATKSMMASYMTIRMFSVIAIVGIEVLGNWYGGLNNTWMAMVCGVITMVVDLVLNFVLVYGYLGAPEMGVDGAALSTAIASWTGFAFLVVAFWARMGGAPRVKTTGLSRRELWRVVRFGLPNGLNWFLEFAAFQVFVNFVFGGLGDVPVAALNVVIAINSVSFMPAWGIATAGSILAGQAIGRGARDQVWSYVKITLACTMTWMTVIGIGYLLFPDELLSLFDSGDPELVSIGVSMLVISALWQVFDAIGLTLSETLRAAGDTAWTAMMRLVLAWLVFMPLSYLVVGVLDGGPIGAMVCLVIYLALLAGALSYRFRSGAWRRIELIEPKLV
jgi:MATE family multidrug resistance protein